MNAGETLSPSVPLVAAQGRLEKVRKATQDNQPKPYAKATSPGFKRYGAQPDAANPSNQRRHFSPPNQLRRQNPGSRNH